MTKARVRVLHVLGALSYGGVQTWLRQLMRWMPAAEFELSFCTLGEGAGIFKNEFEARGAKVVECPISSNAWGFRSRFRGVLRNGGYDVVHSHVHLFSGAVLRWAKAEGVPVRIAQSHTSRDDRRNTAARRCYRTLMRSWIQSNATHGLAASQDAAANLFGDNWMRDQRFRVFYCGINLEPFEAPLDRAEVRRKLGLPQEAQVAGHVGQFVPAKNHRFILKIAKETIAKNPEAHFLLAGDGPLRAAVEAEAKSLGLDGRLHFAGARDDIPQLMRGAMDMLVFPSLWEGLPVALLEAQAAGLPSVVSDTIPREIEVASHLMTRMSLSKSPAEWATGVLDALKMQRVEGREAVKSFRNSDFRLEKNAEILSRIYAGLPGGEAHAAKAAGSA